jgi:hypothetical protein
MLEETPRLLKQSYTAKIDVSHPLLEKKIAKKFIMSPTCSHEKAQFSTKKKEDKELQLNSNKKMY